MGSLVSGWGNKYPYWNRNTVRTCEKAHPAILVNNIDKLKEHLTKMRVDFTVDHKLPGATRFYITDPFGNRIEFLEWEE